jgi:hexulose-6-phosphate isomerase
MRLGFSLVVEKDGLESLLRAVQEAGFAGVEPTFHPRGLPSPEDPVLGARVLREVAERVRLAVPSMRGGPLFWDAFPFRAEETLALTDKALRAVKAMGGDLLLVVPGRWRRGTSYVEMYRKAVALAKGMASMAETVGVRIGFENVESKFLLSPREWCEFLDDVNSPWVGAYFDVGNVHYTGLGHPQDWIRDLGGRIQQVHLKDAREKEILPLKEGDVDWAAAMAALAIAGYDGWAFVELPLPAAKDAPAFLRRTAQQASEIVSLAAKRVS